MTSANVWAVVLVKPLHLAKRRLMPVLQPPERMALAQAMLEDVLDAVTASGPVLRGLIVVTRDETAAQLARQSGAVVLEDDEHEGMNGALRRASDYIAGASGDGMIVIPADLPHLRPQAIATMVELLDRPRAVVVAESHDGGTNMLGCRPPAIITPAFGDDSCRQHCDAARRAGTTPTLLAGFGLEHDIDRPDDLEPFLALGTATRTHAYLTRIGVFARVAPPMVRARAALRYFPTAVVV